jgi:ABC-2 type transport system ATP-binding protein
MIRVKNLNKSYGEIHALDNISFEVPANCITTISGADGAGKSTIFKILIGLVKKDSGDLYLNNKNINSDYQKVTSIAGYMPERFSLYPDLSVEENLNFYADIHQVPVPQREARKKRLLETTGMIQFKKRKARDLSGGMKQKLSLSSILLSAPQLIILDEPTTGVDPLSRIEFFNIINELKQEGKTILISTPYLDEAEKSDNIIFIKEGQIIKSGSLSEMKDNFPVKLYKILPQGNVYEILEKLSEQTEFRDNLYIRGKYLKYTQVSQENFLHLIPSRSVEEEIPRLEDIYLFYERQARTHLKKTNAANN